VWFGAIFGLIVGLPALRLRTSISRSTTLGSPPSSPRLALAWQSVTGAGSPAPDRFFPEPFSSAMGLYYFCFALRRSAPG